MKRARIEAAVRLLSIGVLLQTGSAARAQVTTPDTTTNGTVSVATFAGVPNRLSCRTADLTLLADLDVDANGDGIIDEKDDPIETVQTSAGGSSGSSVGGLSVMASDGGGAVTASAGGTIAGGGYVAVGQRVTMPMWKRDGYSGTFTLSWTSTKIKVYDSLTSTTPITSGASFPNADKVFYVEGVDVSAVTASGAVIPETINLTPSVAGGKSDPVDFIVLKVEFLEDATTDYNFSPSLSEQAKLKVKVSPTPPTGGFVGFHFKIEIVRELKGGGEQHIDWLDVDEPDYLTYRKVDFGTKAFVWNGVPATPYGDGQDQAQGPESFAGVSDSFNRVLPKVTLGACVPPPIYKAVATIRRNSGLTEVCEARQTILVPQVVKMVYEDDAVTLLRSPVVDPEDGDIVIAQVTDAQWNAFKAQLPVLIEATYGATVNLRVVDASANPQQPYSVVKLIKGLIGGMAPQDFPNADPRDEATIDVVPMRDRIVQKYVADPTFAIPVTSTELANHRAHAGAHEIGHMLGLVQTGPILDGGTPYCHNKPPLTPLMTMNPGEVNTVEQRLGRDGAWGWKPLNKKYLEFVLPVK